MAKLYIYKGVLLKNYITTAVWTGTQMSTKDHNRYSQIARTSNCARAKAILELSDIIQMNTNISPEILATPTMTPYATGSNLGLVML